MTWAPASSAAQTRRSPIAAPAYSQPFRWLSAVVSGLARRMKPKPARASLPRQACLQLIEIELLAAEAKRAKRRHSRSSRFEAKAHAIRHAILAAGPGR